ncbi:MAG: biopolymer transporter ExbD [Leptospirales bacterium]|jgi:biopolymer transport protein ExbD
MRKSRKSNQPAPSMETRSGIDLAPMVDIIFLLLAYFLINSTLAKTPAIRIDLPQSETASYVGEEAIDILVRADGAILVNETEISRAELAASLKATVAGRAAEPEINIKSDAAAQYQYVIGVIDEVQKAGLSNFNLTTNRR